MLEVIYNEKVRYDKYTSKKPIRVEVVDDFNKKYIYYIKSLIITLNTKNKLQKVEIK